MSLDNATVTFRVGKVKDGVESGEEKVEKDYASAAAARANIISKIKDKLTKGYVSEVAKHVEPPKEEIKANKGEVIRTSDKRFKAFSGEYYERNDGKDNVKV